jgi:hypothetical protein
MILSVGCARSRNTGTFVMNRVKILSASTVKDICVHKIDIKLLVFLVHYSHIQSPHLHTIHIPIPAVQYSTRRQSNPTTVFAGPNQNTKPTLPPTLPTSLNDFRHNNIESITIAHITTQNASNAKILPPGFYCLPRRRPYIYHHRCQQGRCSH